MMQELRNSAGKSILDPKGYGRLPTRLGSRQGSDACRTVGKFPKTHPLSLPTEKDGADSTDRSAHVLAPPLETGGDTYMIIRRCNGKAQFGAKEK